MVKSVQRVLITGASGFIGQELTHNLKERGLFVRALLHRDCKGLWDESLIGDLASDQLPSGLMAGIDTVFHLAGKVHALSEVGGDEDEYQRVNVEGAKKLLQLAQQNHVERFVFFSSVKAMGEGGEQCLDETCDLPPATPYGRSKLEAEKLVLTGGYVPHPVVLRLAMVYGGESKGNLVRMIDAVKRGRFPPLPETGNHRSMVHVKDVVQAAVLVAERQEAAGKTYIVTDEQAYSTRQIYNWICEALGKKPPSWHIPLFVLRGLARCGDAMGAIRGRRFVFDSDALEKLTGSAWYDSSKICRELGYRPAHNLHDALRQMMN